MHNWCTLEAFETIEWVILCSNYYSQEFKTAFLPENYEIVG